MEKCAAQNAFVKPNLSRASAAEIHRGRPNGQMLIPITTSVMLSTIAKTILLVPVLLGRENTVIYTLYASTARVSTPRAFRSFSTPSFPQKRYNARSFCIISSA